VAGITACRVAQHLRLGAIEVEIDRAVGVAAVGISDHGDLLEFQRYGGMSAMMDGRLSRRFGAALVFPWESLYLCGA
jgi:hypothetical protein